MGDPGSPPPATEAIPGATGDGARVRRFVLQVVEGGERAGTEWQSTGSGCSIGTDPSNDLVIDDPTVSRFHCEVAIERGEARLRDLGSRNGTTLDGVRVFAAAPRGGSLIRIGRTSIRFTFADAHNQLPVSDATRFGNLVGRSIAMRTLFALLERAAASEATVLLHGETGTGKEAAARAIHDGSARRGKPYIVVDCGAITANLLESELFGHEKGSFTGASERRVGAFEAAGGGTVFLDEIGELQPDLQPKLLRVLESRQVRRIGSNEHRPVDVRVVAASNRDLRAEVNEGRFRADLYYRLGVVRVTIPPLRERPEDIPDLVHHILDMLGAEEQATERLTSPEVLRNLQGFAWMGNVRELRNYLEQCLVLDDPMPVSEALGAEPSTLAVDAAHPFYQERSRVMADFERRYVEQLLQLHRGNISAAARAAGIGRVFLYRLLDRHRLR